jgi:hypothetical protein
MQARDNPLNRSTRPLLERRAQPQVVSTPLSSSSSASSQNSSPTVIKSLKSYNAPGLLTGGFNDFHAIPKQYDTLNSIHFQFPYGSPPSPVREGDFRFSDDNQCAVAPPIGGHNPMKNPAIVTNRKLIANNGTNKKQQQQQQQQRKYNSIDSSNETQQKPPQNVNVRNYTNHYNNNQNHQSSHDSNVVMTPNVLDCNDFSWYPVPPPRNFNTATATQSPRHHRADGDSGPFVFGIHNQMYEANNKSAVIGTRNKYSLSDSEDGFRQHKQSPNSSQVSYLGVIENLY